MIEEWMVTPSDCPSIRLPIRLSCDPEIESNWIVIAPTTTMTTTEEQKAEDESSVHVRIVFAKLW